MRQTHALLQHFAEICETIWSKIEHQERLEKATAEKMRQIVANMAMIAWNMCLILKSANETKKALRRLAEEKYDGMPPVKPICKSSKSCNKLPLELKSGGNVWNAKDGVVNIGRRSCQNIGIAA